MPFDASYSSWIDSMALSRRVSRGGLCVDAGGIVGLGLYLREPAAGASDLLDEALAGLMLGEEIPVGLGEPHDGVRVGSVRHPVVSHVAPGSPSTYQCHSDRAAPRRIDRIRKQDNEITGS
jgi:hypothetical protein